jgi:hypothetical protein
MKYFLKKHILKIIGIFVGSVAGFLYYHFIGCSSGTCPITSNPYMTVAYGALLGYLFSDMFRKKERK